VSLAHPVETNEIFAHVPEALARGMEARGVGFYRWEEDGRGVLIRLVTSFATTHADIDAVLRAAREAAAG
jgi:threonine aldolase